MFEFNELQEKQFEELAEIFEDSYLVQAVKEKVVAISDEDLRRYHIDAENGDKMWSLILFDINFYEVAEDLKIYTLDEIEDLFTYPGYNQLYISTSGSGLFLMS